jgi:hypothetical protein
MAEETNPEQKNSNRRKTIAVSVLATIAVILVILGSYWTWKKYSQSQKDLAILKQQMEDLQKGSGTGSSEIQPTGDDATATGAENDEYAGWKTYTNSEIGYTLRYPADWTLKEIDQFSELLDTTVKYITITTPDKKYFLNWGLKRKTDAFAISDRTGIGAGDFQKDGKIAILGKEYDITRFIFNGKTKEVFYPSTGLAVTADGKYNFTAALSYGSGSDYDSLDIDNISEKALAEKILQSVALTAGTTSAGGCTQNFTNEEKLDKANWKTYTNAKYGYSFKYPKDWLISDHEDKRVAMGNAVDKIFFSWNSEEMTAFDYMGYHQTSKKNATVACQNAEETFLSGDNGTPNEKSRLIFADFKKNGKRHLITYNYQDIGASISGDLIDMFNLILKTVEFSK